MKTSTSKSSVITQVFLAAVAIVLGYLLIFQTSIQIISLCQVLCGGIVAVGVASIASFFLAGDYKRIDRYGFALGTMLILMGLIGLIRINDLTANFEIYTGVVALVLGVVVLQGTVQMKVLDYPIWILNLIISLICLSGAFCVLSGITIITERIEGFSSWVLLISGVSCLISLSMTWICIVLAEKREKKIQAEKEEAAKREEQARKEAEEAARLEEQARKDAEEKAKQAETALKEAQEKAKREELAQKQAEALARRDAMREEMAKKNAERRAQKEAASAQEPANSAAGTATDHSFPPVESPNLVFGSNEAGGSTQQ